VHVGIDHAEVAGALQQPCQPSVYKAFLRSEVLAREGPVPEAPVPAKRPAVEADGARLAGGEFKAAGSTKVVSSGKVPKWLKLGK